MPVADMPQFDVTIEDYASDPASDPFSLPLVRHRLMTDTGVVYECRYHDSKGFSWTEEITVKASDKFYVPLP